ncbi:MAG: SPOR domain-containing protein, partial [Fibrobacter sp.]|nr:SPOR domain-containing protein [Fibrobacter sp.]
ASSQIESLRAKKREIEGSIKLPLVIVFETPYYKLLAGDFAERSEAEANITKLKKMGYADAWIVSSKANIITN